MYEKLTKYIPMLESKEYGVKSHGMGGSDYNKPLQNMIDAIFELVNPEKDYNGMLEKAAGVDAMDITMGGIEQIDTSMLDGDTVFSLIYFIVLMEKTNGGLILRFCKNGCFLKWLKRLKEIDEGEVPEDK